MALSQASVNVLIECYNLCFENKKQIFEFLSERRYFQDILNAVRAFPTFESLIDKTFRDGFPWSDRSLSSEEYNRQREIDFLLSLASDILQESRPRGHKMSMQVSFGISLQKLQNELSKDGYILDPDSGKFVEKVGEGLEEVSKSSNFALSGLKRKEPDKQKKGVVGLKFETAFHTYTSLGIVGEGGSGIVYKVSDENEKIYSLKILSLNKVTPEKQKRFENEIHFCEKNVHKNIITVKDSGFQIQEGIKCPFYVMPYYGTTLRSLMKDKIPSADILKYFSQILDGVEAAHLLDVWHRDLKPENIFYDRESHVIVIADFGIAHFHEDILLTTVETHPDSRLANFQYAAPEQRIKGRMVDQRADIYSLGLILNEMFTGEILQGVGYKKIAEVSPDYSYLDGVVEKMVQQSPIARPPTIAEIKKEFIAREHEFVSLQKVSELKKAIVLQSEIDDPLVLDPLKVIGVDYDRGQLILKLNHSVNQRWIHCYENIGGYSWTTAGIHPESFQIHYDTASISIGDNHAKDAIQFFKEYLEKANTDYKKSIEEDNKRHEQQLRQELQKKVRNEEIKQQLLQNL